MFLSVRRQRQIGANHVCDMNAGAKFRSHQSTLRIEGAEASGHGQLFCVRVQHRRGAKAKLADPRAENEGNKQSLLYRHLAADAWCFAWVIIGLDRTDDGERIGVVSLTLTLSRSWERG